jgi:hypothetical protein
MIFGIIQNFLKRFFIFYFMFYDDKRTCGGEDSNKENTPPVILLKKKRALSPIKQGSKKTTKLTPFSTPNSPYRDSKEGPSSTPLDSASMKRKIEESFRVPTGTIEILQNNNHRNSEKMGYPHIVKVCFFSMAMKNEDIDSIFTPTKQSVLRSLQMDPDKTREKTKKFKTGETRHDP